MALLQTLKAIARFWPVAVVGVLLTCVAAGVALRDTSVYWSRTNIVFLAPSSTLYPNSLKTLSEDLVITAGIVAKRVNGPDRVLKYASTDPTIIGVPPDGTDYWLRLPDTGGQWSVGYNDQLLLLDVKGNSIDEARRTRDEVIARVRDELNLMQREHGVAPVNDITVTVAPAPPVLARATGSTTRALGMIAVLGGGATLAAVALLEHRRLRREQLLAQSSRTGATRDRRAGRSPSVRAAPH